jgi:chromosome segregation ATPase
MKSNEQEQRIILLNEYAQCLERENQAKGTEISTLHGMLQRMEQENLHLRAGLDEMRLRLEQKEKLRNASCSLQTSIDLEQRVGCVAFDACCQTREDEEYECIDQINQMLSLSQTIKEKDEIISKYHKECEEMFEAIEKLESSNRTLQERHVGDKDLMNKLEDKLRKEEQKRTNAEQRLEDISYNIYSAGEEVDNYRKQTTKLEKDIDQLITENNSLI